MRRNYEEYLKSDEWRELSSEVRHERGNRCEYCGRPAGVVELHCHHMTYERFGCEEKTDLLILCRSHHDLYHRVYPGNRMPRLPVEAMKNHVFGILDGFKGSVIKSSPKKKKVKGRKCKVVNVRSLSNRMGTALKIRLKAKYGYDTDTAFFFAITYGSNSHSLREEIAASMGINLVGYVSTKVNGAKNPKKARSKPIKRPLASKEDAKLKDEKIKSGELVLGGKSVLSEEGKSKSQKRRERKERRRARLDVRRKREEEWEAAKATALGITASPPLVEAAKASTV